MFTKLVSSSTSVNLSHAKWKLSLHSCFSGSKSELKSSALQHCADFELDLTTWSLKNMATFS